MGNTRINFMDSYQGEWVPLEKVAVRLHPDDDVAIAKIALQSGTALQLSGSADITIRQFLPMGHKIALREIPAGAPIRRYGQIIGFASQPVFPGDHVHSHNLNAQGFDRDYAFGVDVKPVEYSPENERRTFLGYRRADGRVGTRNYVAVIATVNCSAHTTKEIAHHFTHERLVDYPNIDGVIAIAHSSGCGLQYGGDGYHMLQRTLAGMSRNPNIGAYIIVGLGCEMNQTMDLVNNYRLGQQVPTLTIQETGGIRKTVQAGIEAIEELLPFASSIGRTPQPVSELMVALQCGGSDSWSGITANPALGMAADELVRQGGTTVLAETPEIYGAEHLLTRRAVSREVGEKLIEKVRWWEHHTARSGVEIDNNPTVGNKAGGLTTIYEKSLGAVAKGGSTPLTGVYDYAEPITARGFTFMDTPGYDPVAVTGQVAGGCNLVVFTTGRGSVFGFKPAPSIKICTNPAVYERMAEDMDVNAGKILDGVSMETVASEIFELMIAVASGQPSKSEAQGVGESEFIPWYTGVTL